MDAKFFTNIWQTTLLQNVVSVSRHELDDHKALLYILYTQPATVAHIYNTVK